jgi:cytochrome P450
MSTTTPGAPAPPAAPAPPRPAPSPPLRAPPRRPEGPGGLLERVAFVRFGVDPLGFVERLTREHPGAARLALPGIALVFLTDLDAIGEALLDREHVLVKDWTIRVLGAVLGQGLLNSEGDLWRRQRAIVAPALHRKQIASYVDITARRAAAYAAGLGDGAVRDVKPDMARLAMEIVAESLFGTDVDNTAPRVSRALEDAMGGFEELIYTWRRFLPATWKQSVRRRIEAAAAAMDAVVAELIARKRAGSAPGQDLLSRLLAARDEQGAALPDRQVRDEVLTMLLAGHETTAMALSFALWFLARDPAAAARVADEAARLLGARAPAAADVPRLEAAEAAFKETLRLRPPVWIFGREAERDCVLGRWQIRRGEQVLICPWLVHRDPRHFERSAEFLPGRWAEGLEERLPRHAYLPFGSGPRVCAGMHFALMEGTVVLATLCRAFRLAAADVDAGEPALAPAITLRPRGAVRIRFTRRPPAAPA